MREIIVGGPRTGKSTRARAARALGIPTFCGDPRSLVKEPEDGVTYLPEFLDLKPEDRWSAGSAWVASKWFRLPGPWVMEGQIMVRALRKWTSAQPPCDRIVVLSHQYAKAVTKPGQRAMHVAVMNIWREIAPRFAHLVVKD